MDIDIINARVALGAKTLDAHTPFWYRRVYVEALAIEHCERCVLGQVFMDFANGMDILCAHRDAMVRYQFALDRGFETEGDGIEAPEEITYLEKAWYYEIAERFLNE